MLRAPYLIPYFRAFFEGTTIEEEEALDRSAPPEFWESALSKNDLRSYHDGKLADKLPWLKEKNNA